MPDPEQRDLYEYAIECGPPPDMECLPSLVFREARDHGLDNIDLEEDPRLAYRNEITLFGPRTTQDMPANSRRVTFNITVPEANSVIEGVTNRRRSNSRPVRPSTPHPSGANSNDSDRSSHSQPGTPDSSVESETRTSPYSPTIIDTYLDPLSCPLEDLERFWDPNSILPYDDVSPTHRDFEAFTLNAASPIELSHARASRTPPSFTAPCPTTFQAYDPSRQRWVIVYNHVIPGESRLLDLQWDDERLDSAILDEAGHNIPFARRLRMAWD
ncbi:MAG: hypothetical protein Q9227_008420 [Pyrenula ochraceoflavens]